MQYIPINDRSVCDNLFEICFCVCSHVHQYVESFLGGEFAGIFTGGCCPDRKQSPWLQFSCSGIRGSSSMVPVQSHSGVLKTGLMSIYCVGYNAEILGWRCSGFVSGCSLPKFSQLDPWSRILCWLIFFLSKKSLMWTCNNSMYTGVRLPALAIVTIHGKSQDKI